MFDHLPLIQELISPAVHRLHSLDIEPQLTVLPFVHEDQLDAFNSEFALTLPRQVRELYAETDGFDIRWRAGDDWGAFSFPSLYELRLHRQGWINGYMQQGRWITHLEPELERVLANMKAWLPFDDSGSGDLMCLDCSDGRVIEYDHEWGNMTGQNGTIYANDLFDYVRQCARICFHCVWLAFPKEVLRCNECWADWQSTRVPHKYVVAD